MYSHADKELIEMKIVHVIACMDNVELYDELVQDDDVLIIIKHKISIFITVD